MKKKESRKKTKKRAVSPEVEGAISAMPMSKHPRAIHPLRAPYFPLAIAREGRAAAARRRSAAAAVHHSGLARGETDIASLSMMAGARGAPPLCNISARECRLFNARAMGEYKRERVERMIILLSVMVLRAVESEDDLGGCAQ